MTEPTELQFEKNEAEPLRNFSIGDEVQVMRAIRDETGAKLGETIEGGWKVILVEDYTDGSDKIVTVQMEDHEEQTIATKRYKASKLSDIQSASEAPVAQIEAPEVAASKNILGFSEQEVTPEREVEVEHIQEEMAEVALGEVVEDPEEAEAQPEGEMDKEELERFMETARIQYNTLTNIVKESVATDLNRSVGRIEEAGGAIVLGNRITLSLEEDRNTLLRIANGVLDGNYNDESARTLLNQAAQTLQGTYARLRNIGEETIPDVRRSMVVLKNSLGEADFEFNRSDANFNNHSAELVQKNPSAGLTAEVVSSEVDRAAVKAVEGPIGDIIDAVGSVESEVSENAQALRVIVNQIEEVTQQSYRGTVDIDALQSLAKRLTGVMENTQRLNTFSGTVEEAVLRIKASAAQLSSE